MRSVKAEQLLYEVEDIIRTMPGPRDFSVNQDKCVPWLGRASAAIAQWNPGIATVRFEPLVQLLNSGQATDFSAARRAVLIYLHQAQNDLRLQSAGPSSVAINSGMVFEYFDELRKVIETAKIDAYFVDPYIDADFVSRYLPFTDSSTNIRILAREKITTLLPSIKAFIAQEPRSIEVRTAPKFHDRYLFVDRSACFQSGASFKDGAKNAPTTLTQITDAFVAVDQTYDQLWNKGESLFINKLDEK